jgi:hypothetical protein
MSDTTSRDNDARQAAATEPSQTEPDTQPVNDAAPGAETTTETLDEAKKPDPTAKPTPDQRDQAIRQMAFEARETRRQLQAAREQIERNAPPHDPNAPPSPADVERLVEQRAQAIIDQRAQAEATQTWVAAGNAAYPDFTERCNELASMGAAENPAFMAAIGRVQDGHKVIAELASDPAETARILKLPPVDLAIAVATMSHKIAAAPPPPPKPTTQAPPPIRPLATAARAEVNLSNLDGAAFRSAFLKQFNSGSR